MVTEKLTINDYLNAEFPGQSSRPSPRTVRHWIQSGKLTGEKIGGKWYIYRVISTGRPDVDQILREIS